MTWNCTRGQEEHVRSSWLSIVPGRGHLQGCPPEAPWASTIRCARLSQLSIFRSIIWFPPGRIRIIHIEIFVPTFSRNLVDLATQAHMGPGCHQQEMQSGGPFGGEGQVLFSLPQAHSLSSTLYYFVETPPPTFECVTSTILWSFKKFSNCPLTHHR